jgi:hypothetical protein
LSFVSAGGTNSRKRSNVSINARAHIDFDVAELFGLSNSRANTRADAASADPTTPGARPLIARRSRSTPFTTEPVDIRGAIFTTAAKTRAYADPQSLDYTADAQDPNTANDPNPRAPSPTAHRG